MLLYHHGCLCLYTNWPLGLELTSNVFRSKLRDELQHDFTLVLAVALALSDTLSRVGNKREQQPISTVPRNVMHYHRRPEDPAMLPIKNRYGALDEETSMM